MISVDIARIKRSTKFATGFDNNFSKFWILKAPYMIMALFFFSWIISIIGSTQRWRKTGTERETDVFSVGLTLPPFSGKHLHPPLQSLPPQGPLCFFPPCRTQRTQHESQSCAFGGHIFRKLEHFAVHLIYMNPVQLFVLVLWLAVLSMGHITRGVWHNVVYCRCDVTSYVCVHTGLSKHLWFMCVRLLFIIVWCAERMFCMRLEWLMVEVPWKSSSSNSLSPAADWGQFVCRRLRANQTTHHHRPICARRDTINSGHDLIKDSSHTNGVSPSRGQRWSDAKPAGIAGNGIKTEWCLGWLLCWCGVSNENHMQNLHSSFIFGSCAATTFLTDQRLKQNN